MSYLHTAGSIMLHRNEAHFAQLAPAEAAALLDAHRSEYRKALNAYDKPLIEVAEGLHEELRRAIVAQEKWRRAGR